MNILIRSILSTGFGVLLLQSGLMAQPAGTPDSPEGSNPLKPGFDAAVERAEEAHREEIDSLLTFYDAHLEKLASEAQSQGDLERLLKIKAEQETVQTRRVPGDVPISGSVDSAREVVGKKIKELEEEQTKEMNRLYGIYIESLDELISKWTREGRTEEATALREEKKKIESKLAANQPGAPPQNTDGVRLGPNLLTQGNIDDGDRWGAYAPGSNRTGPYKARDSGGDPAIRIEQHERKRVVAHTHVPIKAGKPYRIRWKVRLHRPWDEDIALRGKGHYRIDLNMNPAKWRSLTPAEQARYGSGVGRVIQPPDTQTWEWKHVDLTPGLWMNRLRISASRGEGDFLIDDIEVREILPEPGKKK